MVKKNDGLGLSPDISRRDFVNGTLVGFGVALLGSKAPLYAASQKPVGVIKDPWTGYGGVGDYAVSNGNVASVRDAAHLIRDGLTKTMLEDADDINEEYDMVIIGGGFSGIGAAYQFHKKYGNTRKCLILENHPVFGGEAKQNEFEVDGYKLYGPQGSNDFGPPQKESDDLIADIYRDTGLPFEYEFVKQAPGESKVKAPLENYYGMFWEEARYDTGYFMGEDADTPWVINPRADNLARMPWSDKFKAELNRAFEDKEDYYTGEDLDRPESPLKIRLNSTAINVSHAGPSRRSDHVNVSYHQNGKVKKIKAKTVVMSIGGWVARNIVSDMPAQIVEAYSQFYHSPVLVVNVALRNWRFLDKLGISSGRWFEGFGNFFSIRRPMITGQSTQPFDPAKPVVMTFYVPFNNPGYSTEEQGSIGRAELLSKSYRDYEKEIIEQMRKMFSANGFKAERDVAGIVLNRWGHAYISPQPGFHFGKDGKDAPKDIVKKGFGRIQFGHSELSGYMSHTRALKEGARAASAAMKQI